MGPDGELTGMDQGGPSRGRVTTRVIGRAAVALAAVVVVGAAGAACGGGGTSSPTTAPRPARPASSTPVPATSAPAGGTTSSTPGCEVTPRPASGTSTLRLTVAGVERLVILHVSAGDPSSPIPLVLNMHGSQSTAAEQEALTGMDATADADDFIVAYPQGAIPAGGGFEWNVPGQPLVGGSAVPTGSPDDVTFLEDVVSDIEHDHCVNADRVYATGFSGGARMASQLGCDASTTIAAVAPVSGLRLPVPCASTRPVPVVAFHGTADPVDPYLGNGQAYWTYSVPAAASRWAAHNGCAAGPVVSQVAPSVTRTAYGPCTADASVELYTLAGEGHEWPGGPTLPRSLTRILGPQSDAVDANTVMWAFFEDHPLP